MLTAISITNMAVYLFGSTGMARTGRWGWFLYGIGVVALNGYAIWHPHVLISLFMAFRTFENLVGDQEIPADITPRVLVAHKVFMASFMALNFAAAVIIGVH